MTPAEQAAWAERQQAETAQKLREAAILAEADALFAKALKQEDLAARPLDDVLRAYENAESQVKNSELQDRITVQLVLVRAMKRIQSALLKKADPGPLPNFDFERAREVFGVGAEIEALFAAHKLAQKTAQDAQHERPDGQQAIDGWVSRAGPDHHKTGATHRIVKDQRVIALIKSSKIDLDSFAGLRVRVTGKAAGEAQLGPEKEKTPILEVVGVEPLFE